MKTILKEILFYETNKEKQSYFDKQGRPFSRVQIKVEGESDKLSGFAYQDSPMRRWKVGQEIEIEVESKTVNGKTYKNFRLASNRPAPISTSALSEISTKLDEINKKLDLLAASKVEMDKEEDDFSDLPF